MGMSRASYRRLLALSLAFLVLGLASCGGSNEDFISANASEVYRFDDLDVMVATSDAVVRGTVLSVRPGRTAGGKDAGHAMSFREVVLRVDAVFHGPDLTDTIVLEEAGAWGGKPVVMNNVRPSKVGDSGVYFLTLRKDSDLPRYILVSSQGRYLLSKDQLEGSNPEDPLVQELQSLSVPDLEERVHQASEAVEQGEVQPLPDLCCVSPTPE
jgi:hypothetical protein